MKSLVILPIIIPLVTASLTLLFRRFQRMQKGLGLAGSIALFAASLVLAMNVYEKGIIVHHVGNWPAPYGIPLVADALASIMIILTGLIGVSVATFSLKDIRSGEFQFGFMPLFHMLLMGVCGAFLTGDLFNLYVWFEVLLIASFVLMTLGGRRPQIEGSLKYVTINLLASMFLLCGVGILYGKVGTLNLADLSHKLSISPHSQLVTSSAMLLLVAFSIKSAAFPFFFWLPDSYHTPAFSVSALFAGLLTKVGVYAMIRTFILIYRDDISLLIILVIAGLTMVIGVFGAVIQKEIRRLLSFHIISQIGYSLMGLGIASRLSLTAAIFFTFHVAVAKAALFLVAATIGHEKGSTALEKVGGLYQTHPWLSLFFVLPALSLAGLPPLSGFAAKLALIQAGLKGHHSLIVFIALFVSILTLYSMAKIWTMAFWGPEQNVQITRSEKVRPQKSVQLFDGLSISFWIPLVLLTAVTLGIGIFAEPLLQFCQQAADTLLQPAIYNQAVLTEAR